MKKSEEIARAHVGSAQICTPLDLTAIVLPAVDAALEWAAQQAEIPNGEVAHSLVTDEDRTFYWDTNDYLKHAAKRIRAGMSGGPR